MIGVYLREENVPDPLVPWYTHRGRRFSPALLWSLICGSDVPGIKLYPLKKMVFTQYHGHSISYRQMGEPTPRTHTSLDIIVVVVFGNPLGQHCSHDILRPRSLARLLPPTLLF